MKRIVAAVVAVVVMVCVPYTFFPGQPDWYKLEAKKGGKKKAASYTALLTPVQAEATGRGHGGGHGEGGSSHGGGGNTGGGSSHSGGSVSDGAGVSSATGGALVVTGGQGISAGDRDKLMAAVKACEAERPGLALGDTTSTGGWSFRTYDDTVWPFIYRCMKARGYTPNGTDYSAR